MSCSVVPLGPMKRRTFPHNDTIDAEMFARVIAAAPVAAATTSDPAMANATRRSRLFVASKYLSVPSMQR